MTLPSSVIETDPIVSSRAMVALTTLHVQEHLQQQMQLAQQQYMERQQSGHPGTSSTPPP